MSARRTESVGDVIPSVEIIEAVAAGDTRQARRLIRDDLKTMLGRRPLPDEVTYYLHRCATWLRLYGLEKCRQIIPLYDRRPNQPAPLVSLEVRDILNHRPYPW